jgi:hypothetical protein
LFHLTAAYLISPLICCTLIALVVGPTKMGQKLYPAERKADRFTKDDIAQARLGGTRGSNDLQAAKMTRRQKLDMPPEGGYDPGHPV